MVKRIVKQVAALLIAIAFISSIFFFLPHTGSTAVVSYDVLVPTTELNANASTIFSTVHIGNGQTYSLVAGTSAASVQVLVSSNITNLLNLTEAVLNQQNITYNVSGGDIFCMSSRYFIGNLCTNYSESEAWGLLSAGSNGRLSTDSSVLSSINLNDLYDNTTFLLVYFISNTSGTTNSSLPPLP